MKKYLMVCSLAGEERLHFIGSENSNNLFVCHRESGASTDDERHQMNEVGQNHVVDFINTFRHGSLVMQNLRSVRNIIKTFHARPSARPEAALSEEHCEECIRMVS